MDSIIFVVSNYGGFEKTLDSIIKIKPKNLFVINTLKQEAGLQVADRVTWDCNVQERNTSYDEGLTWAFSCGLDEAVVVESGSILDQRINQFLREMLNYYRHDARAMMVSDNPVSGYAGDYCFTKYAYAKGVWATWKRAWSLYHKFWNPPQMGRKRMVASARPNFIPGWLANEEYWSKQFRLLCAGKLNPHWQHSWFFSMCKSEGFAIAPTKPISEIKLPLVHMARQIPCKRTLSKDLTLIMVDCVDYNRAERVFKHCLAQCNFADAKLLSHFPIKNIFDKIIEPVTSWYAYSDFIINRLADYIETSHCLIVQWDGFITDPTAWTDDFLRYDYIGPIHPEPYLRFGVGCMSLGPLPAGLSLGDCIVGNGGFSLRSRQLLTEIRDMKVGNPHTEDLIVSIYRRKELESKGLRFAPVNVAKRFAVEYGKLEGQFGQHGGYLGDNNEVVPRMDRNRYRRN